MNEAQAQRMPRKEEGQKQPCDGTMKASAIGGGSSEEAALKEATERAVKQAQFGCTLRQCSGDKECTYVQSGTEQGVVEEKRDSDPPMYSVTVTTIGRCRCPGAE
jgi:hypothetical protein